jgi:hypothetical protein
MKSATIELILLHLKDLLKLSGWKLSFASKYYGGIKTFEITITREM